MHGSSFDDASFVWSQDLVTRANGQVKILIQKALA